MKRIPAADIFRSFACLWVFAYHLSLKINLEPSENLLAEFVLSGAYGVAVFFVLSGFLLSVPFWNAYDSGKRMPSIKKFAYKRIIRILPAYYLCLVFCFLLFSNYEVNDFIRFTCALMFVNSYHYITFFPVNLNNPLWSIGVEMMFYLFFGFLMIWMFKLRKNVQAVSFLSVSFIVLFIINYAINYFYPLDGEGKTLFDLAKRWLPGYNPTSLFLHFLLGVFGAKIYLLFSNKFNKSIYFDLALVAVVVIYITIQFAVIEVASLNIAFIEKLFIYLYIIPSETFAYGFPLFSLLVMILLAMFPMTLYFEKWLDNTFIRWTATLSYGIYIWHYVICFWALEALVPIFRDLDSVHVKLLFTVSSIIATYAIASLSWYCFEKPILKIAQRYKV